MDGRQLLEKISNKLTKEIQILQHKYPHRVRCNVCHWNGRTLFDDSWHPRTICPRCRSRVRHRLLFAAVQTLPDLQAQYLFKNKNILHFAPEAFFSRFLTNQTKRYTSADPFRSDVSAQIDMCNMSDIENGSFDVVIACDVLEHVPDDTIAIREIHRVLADGGWVILTVPQKDGLKTKYEDPTITTPEERKRVFGQEDHLRIYGNDFDLFLEEHDFVVTVVNEKSFDSETVQKHVLFPPVLSEHPLATNYRSVYFGQKKGA